MNTLDSIREETAFYEAAHAVIVHVCGGACDVDLISEATLEMVNTLAGLARLRFSTPLRYLSLDVLKCNSLASLLST